MEYLIINQAIDRYVLMIYCDPLLKGSCCVSNCSSFEVVGARSLCRIMANSFTMAMLHVVDLKLMIVGL